MNVIVTLGEEFKRKAVNDDADITLLTIYDKGEIANVTDKYIQWLVEQHQSR